MLSRPQADLLLSLVKNRALVMRDDKHADSPFPYDKKFFKRIRPDQVPRFYRCLTDPQKLPVRWMSLSDLSASQNRVDIDKVESIRQTPGMSPITVVKLRKNGPDYILDGLHRASADWLDHQNMIQAYYCDLSDKEKTVEPVPGAGRFDHAANDAEMRQIDSSEAFP